MPTADGNRLEYCVSFRTFDPLGNKHSYSRVGGVHDRLIVILEREETFSLRKIEFDGNYCCINFLLSNFFLIRAICTEWFTRYHHPVIYLLFVSKIFQTELNGYQEVIYLLGNILNQSNIRSIYRQYTNLYSL